MKSTHKNFPKHAGMVLASVIAAFVLTACGGGSDGGSGGVTPGQNGTVEAGAASLPAGKECGIGGMPQQLLAAINAARAQARMCGSVSMPAAPAIGYWNTRLADAAIRHSTDMAGKGFFSHTGSDGSSSVDRAIQAGYVAGGSGETLSRGTLRSTTTQVVNGLLASPAHCAILMDQIQMELGASCVRSSDSYKFYWTIDFGAGS